MIRGALILAVGFSLGYAKALHDQEDIREDLSTALTLLKELNEELRRAADAVDSTATEETPDTDHLEQGEQEHE